MAIPYDEIRPHERTRVFPADDGVFPRRVSIKQYSPGWSYETANYLQRGVQYVAEGELLVKERGKERRLAEGYTILMFPGCQFELFTRSKSSLGFVAFNSAMRVSPANERVIVLEPDDKASALANLVLDSLQDTGRYGMDLTLTAGDHFAAFSYARAADQFERPKASAAEWVHIARKLIDAQADTNRPLQEILSPVPVSYEHFLRMFKAEWGISPHAWRIRKRVGMAKEMLSNSKEEIAHVAMQLGYSSSQHFATEFRRITGTTPSAFRAKAESRGKSARPAVS